jgi:hypothetical protein
MAFPVHHYYLRGLDDLMLKEGGVVKRTLAHSTGRKSVVLGDESTTNHLAAFPSRHARVAFLLKVLNLLPEQKDPYAVSIDRVMLDRLRDQISEDSVVKAELKKSIDTIYALFRDSSMRQQIKDVERVLANNPSKISYQKRVLHQLRADYKYRQSWPNKLLSKLGINNNISAD